MNSIDKVYTLHFFFGVVKVWTFPCLVSDLIHCTNEMNVNIPQLADSLFERTTNTSWVVVFKSLITTHHLMVYGNEVSSAPLQNTRLRHARFWSTDSLPRRSASSSTWPPGIRCSTSAISWTKVVYKVTTVDLVTAFIPNLLCFHSMLPLFPISCLRLWHVHIHQEV